MMDVMEFFIGSKIFVVGNEFQFVASVDEQYELVYLVVETCHTTDEWPVIIRREKALPIRSLITVFDLS